MALLFGKRVVFSIRNGVLVEWRGSATFTVKVRRNATISHVKDVIWKMKGIPYEAQKLWHYCKELHNDRTLEDFGLHFNLTIHLEIVG